MTTGHMNVLKQAKHALGDPSRVHLIAGICSDADTNRVRPSTPLTKTIISHSNSNMYY